MLTIILIGATLAIIAGAIAKIVFDKTSLRETGTIALVELILGALICTLVVAPAVAAIGFSIARTSAVTFNEYYSGLEVAAKTKTIRCEKDGSCRHTFECDSYQVTEVYYEREKTGTKTETYKDSNGNPQTRTVDVYENVRKTRQVTKYHSCPYVNNEYTYTVSDTLGETYTMGSHWFAQNPNSDRWRGNGWNDPRFSNSLPGGVESGKPTLWVKAKARIDAGTPGGTTQVHTYKNYLLASTKDVYAKSSSAIGDYKKAGVLPKPVTGTYDYYRANKVYAVGSLPGDTMNWQDAQARFNGVFGSQKQGDLHLVVVTDQKVTDPDEYTQALLAYWQSPDLGKNALSKNGYVVVVGSTDGKTVSWARGFSGMPIGNEGVDVAMREDLTGTALTPEALLGTPKSPIDGAVGKVLFDESGGFERVEMKDFDYLYAQIQPTTGQKIVILLIGLFIALIVWGGFLAVDVRIPTAWSAAVASARAKTSRNPEDPGGFEGNGGPVDSVADPSGFGADEPYLPPSQTLPDSNAPRYENYPN